MLLWLFACHRVEQDTAQELSCFDVSPQISVGTGEQEFLSMEPEQELVMVHGPQGGWHMLGSIYLAHTLPIVEIDYTITDIESGTMVSSNHYRVGLVMEDECTGYYPGMYGYLNVQELANGELDTPPELLANHLLLLEMKSNDCTTSQDERGDCARAQRWAQGEFVVRAALDPIDQ